MVQQKTECVICGEHIDKSACNTTRAVFTIISDTDETELKKEKFNFCGLHAASMKVDILTQAFNNKKLNEKERQKIADKFGVEL